MTDYEAALQAARERVVKDATENCIAILKWQSSGRADDAPTFYAAMGPALDHLIRLARAIGAAEAMTDYGDRPAYAQRLRLMVDAIIREMEG